MNTVIDGQVLPTEPTSTALVPAQPTMTDLPARFVQRVHFEPNTGCWLWTGRAEVGGYGRIWYQNRNRLVHRVSYEWERGPIPDGLTIDHLCRQPSCVNPDHMEPVSIGVNVRRGRVGENNRVKTHCPQGHPYAGTNLAFRSNRYGRKCRTCENARNRLYHRTHRRTR
jgi:hypothetical protein